MKREEFSNIKVLKEKSWTFHNWQDRNNLMKLSRDLYEAICTRDKNESKMKLKGEYWRESHSDRAVLYYYHTSDAWRVIFLLLIKQARYICFIIYIIIIQLIKDKEQHIFFLFLVPNFQSILRISVKHILVASAESSVSECYPGRSCLSESDIQPTRSNTKCQKSLLTFRKYLVNGVIATIV